ncbi:MAG: hypothetical protein ACLRZH_02890 [Ruthenibacterium lactatiformans]
MWTVALLLALSGALYGVCAKATRSFTPKRASSSWPWAGSCSRPWRAAVYISGEIPHYVDAFFETVSGFTTTGASVLTDVEAMSHGLLYWRSFTLAGRYGHAGIPAGRGAHGKGAGYSIHLLRAKAPAPAWVKWCPHAPDGQPAV